MKIELLVLLGYFGLLVGITRLSYRKQHTSADFILGSRSLNFWLTALSAHASDMSGWLFLGYPALVFEGGVFAAWAAIGLIVGMFLNWQFVAPRLRMLTEQLGSLTLSSYFEKRFAEGSGKLKLISSLMSILFFTCYISSGLCAMGILVESLLGISYSIGIILGLLIVVTYVLLGGYRTVAWVDLFQGFFLLGVILFIPFYLLQGIGGITPVLEAVSLKNLTTSLLPQVNGETLWKSFLIATSWGLGYFGQPHILTKFMGIREGSEMRKAQYVGMSWQMLALVGATLVGLIGIYTFPEGLVDSQQVILTLVKKTMPPLFAGLVLCAIVAATTNVMAAHLLVVASNLSEDLYRSFSSFQPSAKKLLLVSRGGVILIACIALYIAHLQLSTVYHIVLYSWSGLGASFGPLVLLSLYVKNLHAHGAFAGIFVGGVTAALWPYLDKIYSWQVPAIIPACFLSLVSIHLVSSACNKKAHLRGNIFIK